MDDKPRWAATQQTLMLEGEHRQQALARMVAPALAGKNVMVFTSKLDDAPSTHRHLCERFPNFSIRLFAKKVGTNNRQIHAILICRPFYAGIDLNPNMRTVVFYDHPATDLHAITGRLRITIERMSAIDEKLRALRFSGISVFDKSTNHSPSINMKVTSSCKLIIRGLGRGVTVEELMAKLQQYEPACAEVLPFETETPQSVPTAVVWFPTELLAAACLRDIDVVRFGGDMVMARYALEKKRKR
ncbi:hypothetical protein BDV38DRAFT_279989 [Aspergillus pseudotamarii]|uniref:Uncharacterized protein n=1 Tax=Aspergillus pseudotamarii TaxID=132259 RepID=A0A5N6T2G4_ASPPS|nr:uncharacterized protein BDV38DRAFT_279989 [Aspergillus pseudotamarii]KAE8140487.1 hypothetical protein BDV38DRAFT_279989 [Aspergillus pseudotamarii]